MQLENRTNKLKMILMFFSFIMLMSFVFSESAKAQDVEDIPMTKSKSTAPSKKVKLNFENELVNSSAEKPEIESIFQGTNFNYKKMIKLRQNFIPEAERGQELFNASY